MAADPTLVRGAGRAASKFTKTQLFSAEDFKAANQLTMLKKLKKSARDAEIRALVSDITVDESLTPPQQIDQQYQKAGQLRNQVAALAAEKAKYPVNSPQAFALEQRMSSLKQSFGNIAKNAKDFKDLEKEFIDGGWNMSGGVDEIQREKLNEIFVNKQYSIEYDERGNATYNTKFGNLTQKDLSNYYLKDDEMALSVVNYSDDALNLGTGGTLIKQNDARYNMIASKVRNELRKGGESRLKSLIYDDLVENQNLGLTEIKDENGNFDIQANEDAAVNAIMNNLMEVNKQGYNEHKSKPGNKTGEEESEIAVTRNELESIDIGKDITPDRIYDDQKIEPRPKRFGPRKISDTLSDYNNVIGAEGYQIVVNDAGEYVLENQNPMSQNEREKFGQEEIQDELDELLKGNKDPLIRKLMVEVYGETPMDRKNADKTFAQ